MLYCSHFGEVLLNRTGIVAYRVGVNGPLSSTDTQERYVLACAEESSSPAGNRAVECGRIWIVCEPRMCAAGSSKELYRIRCSRIAKSKEK